MRKFSFLTLLLLLIFPLVSCGEGPSKQAENQALLDQNSEWEAHAETIRQELSASLGGSYDVDLSVVQYSGTIVVSVTAESYKISHSAFCEVIPKLGNRFIDLATEYPDYDFGDITFSFYVTLPLGRRVGEPQIYSVGTDGQGTFLDPGADTPALYNKTPDDIYYFLSGVSPDARSIPDPSFEQEALVEENYFHPVDKIIFTTPANENGLGDTPFWAEGEVVSRSDIGGYDTIHLSTEYGDLYISATYIDFPEINEGDNVTAFFVYSGFSDVLHAPCGEYVYHE